ncbi:MAG TPA: hypothetical protein VMT34_06150, partial [Aggregatilineales bacterium]|nr:hypothetical protein [Aggregatilineales bacterium]
PRLIRFFSRRYKGGLEAVLKGQWEQLPFYNVQAMGTQDIDTFIEKNFSGADRDLARKILEDLRAVKQDNLDFESEQELKTEIFKRLRISQLMKESQANQAFDYPENMKPGDCPDYNPGGYQYNARVNKAARQYWTNAIPDEKLFYYFDLTPLGKQNAYQALTTLFTPQPGSICDRSLIHCDYLTSVIHLRTFAESIGTDEFDRRVQNGTVYFRLTYFGAEYITAADVPSPRGRWASPVSGKSVSLQIVRPASKEDLVIGDHVIFWNHLAYDALTVKRPGPWRLENAVIVDKNDKNEDLFEGHGAPTLGNRTVPGTEDTMLNELLAVYNRIAEAALDLTRQVDAGYANAQQELTDKFPQVTGNPGGEWKVHELDNRDENKRRPIREYKLRSLTTTSDPELVGLRDPFDPTKMGTVERPAESRKEPLPR